MCLAWTFGLIFMIFLFFVIFLAFMKEFDLPLVAEGELSIQIG